MLFIPCLIPLLFCVLAKMNALTITAEKNALEKLSCMDFTNICWGLISGIYIMNIMALVLGVIHFSSEIEGGQIKNYLLRSSHRYSIIISKLLGLFLQFLTMILVFLTVSISSYYIFLDSTSYANGKFVNYMMFNTNSFLLYLFASIMRMLVLVSLSFLIGLKLKPFSCFMTVFLISLAVRYSSVIKGIPLYKLSPDYLLSRINVANQPTLSGWLAILTLMLYIVIFTGAAVFFFRKQDVK